mmetsp:Transcript_32234/g.52352  ORF Transcript_32234/g.52352 Transcript_32234/m.52352 type:complete len:214 (-) Transcript_32234:84-725(-)
MRPEGCRCPSESTTMSFGKYSSMKWIKSPFGCSLLNPIILFSRSFCIYAAICFRNESSSASRTWPCRLPVDSGGSSKFPFNVGRGGLGRAFSSGLDFTSDSDVVAILLLRLETSCSRSCSLFFSSSCCCSCSFFSPPLCLCGIWPVESDTFLTFTSLPLFPSRQLSCPALSELESIAFLPSFLFGNSHPLFEGIPRTAPDSQSTNSGEREAKE